MVVRGKEVMFNLLILWEIFITEIMHYLYSHFTLALPITILFWSVIFIANLQRILTLIWPRGCPIIPPAWVLRRKNVIRKTVLILYIVPDSTIIQKTLICRLDPNPAFLLRRDSHQILETMSMVHSTCSVSDIAQSAVNQAVTWGRKRVSLAWSLVRLKVALQMQAVID